MTGPDFIRPDRRVPREISAAPPLWVELLVVLAAALLLALIVPWFSDWASVDAVRGACP